MRCTNTEKFSDLCGLATFFQYLDKTLINYANVMDAQSDTNTSASQFSYLALLFYVFYLIREIPQGYLMQRFPTAKYLGFQVPLWVGTAFYITQYSWEKRPELILPQGMYDDEFYTQKLCISCCSPRPAWCFRVCCFTSPNSYHWNVVQEIWTACTNWFLVAWYWYWSCRQSNSFLLGSKP